MPDSLRALWDFDDLDATELRFREMLGTESADARAEALTQLARVRGLRGDFAAGDELLDDASSTGSSSRVEVLVELERGRIRRSGGDTAAALPLFEAAFARASRADEHFLAADAAHMAALASPDGDGFVAWTERGIELAERETDARYWLGPLLNNVGWEHFEAGRHEDALTAFERALTERERSPDDAQPIEIARYAVAKTLRALGRSAEAVPLLEQAAAWAEAAGAPDGWFHEELAEAYAALGRGQDAAEQARRALVLLPDADPSFEIEGERAARLRSLAASRD